MISKSERFLQKKAEVPAISNNMVKSVSEYRRGILENEVERGLFRDGSSTPSHNGGPTVLSSSSGIKKSAQVLSSQNSGGAISGTENTVRQGPEIYSPLWLGSNMNMPRDRATINSWCRSFFALQPFVQNAINLHSTYPISKLTIKCPNRKVEKFFNEMIEEIDLMNICVHIAQEYYLLGEAFVYAELDQNRARWSRLIIQNPDYIEVKKSVIANEPNIFLRPDDNLRRICFSNRPSDVAQRQSLNETILQHVKRGENIPLDNFYVSHLARKISPYEVRGTGLPVSCFRQLMLFDKLRECYDEETEVLTDKGFKKINDLMILDSSNVCPNSNFVNGVELDENGKISSVYTMKEDFKVACYNAENKSIEYHKPIEVHMSQYEGKMHHFESRNYDIMVSPNHKMWAQKANRLNGIKGWSEWKKIPAKNINPKTMHKLLGKIDNWQGKNIDSVKVLNKNIPADLYLQFLGLLISEGCLTQKNTINFAQSTKSDAIDYIKNIVRKFAKIFDIIPSEREVDYSRFKSSKQFKKPVPNGWQANIYNKELNEYFSKQIGNNNSTLSLNKVIPSWVLDLNKNHLRILLDAMVAGDGSDIKNKCSNAYRYYTSSKELADDVQEIIIKCGYSVSLTSRKREGTNKAGTKEKNREYLLSWSDARDGQYPLVYQSKQMNIVNYKGVVWCFEVPTGLFITRRNGKITIQGNSKFEQADAMVNPMTLVKIGSTDYKPTPEVIEQYRNAFEECQYDKNFKLFTTEAVTVERVGYGQGIYDISGDITQLLKEIYTGLMVPQIVMDGGGDISYANGGISLDILRQRYMQFRNMMSSWLRNKIFAPISKLNDFYEYEDGEKRLIIPDVDWSHMSLFDTADYVNVLVQLTGDQKKVSHQTLYRSLGLEYEEERRKIKKEDIADAIRKKEVASLDMMPLNELRALNEEDEINEIVPAALPGTSPYSDQSGTAGGAASPGGDMGMGAGLPPLPGMSPSPSGGGGLPPIPSGGLGGPSPFPSPSPSPGGSPSPK